MQYLLLGVAALVLGLLAIRAFTVANPALLARQLTLGVGLAAFAGAGVLALRGAVGYALPLAMLGSWLIWGRSQPSGWGWPAGNPGPAPAASRVVTDHLDVTLDLASGAVEGLVLKGMFAGRRLDSLKPAEMALLWQDCRFSDPASAQILETMLDRLHPTWREDVARGERQMHGGPDGRMSKAEAYEILGLSPGASDEQVRRAHRDLMMKLHPDRGGSTYLAAKINEAKDVLLGLRG